MKDAGILEDDLVAIKSTQDIKNGDIDRKIGNAIIMNDTVGKIHTNFHWNISLPFFAQLVSMKNNGKNTMINILVKPNTPPKALPQVTTRSASNENG